MSGKRVLAVYAALLLGFAVVLCRLYLLALHPAYALCRLLMMHPAPVERQPLEQVREIVKLAAGAPGPLLAAVPMLTGEAARRLRMGLPLAEGGGRVLADWITRLDAESKQEG